MLSVIGFITPGLPTHHEIRVLYSFFQNVFDEKYFGFKMSGLIFRKEECQQ